MMRRQEQDPLCELSTMVLNIIRSPPSPIRSRPPRPITPAGFLVMMLGVSTAMMLCGSVTFCIGFLMMPWVVGLVMVVYVVGVVTTVSMIWRAIFCGCLFSPVDSIRKEASAWNLL